MLNIKKAKSSLLDLLRRKSLFRGDFTLSSGGKSSYYVDCSSPRWTPKEHGWLAINALAHSNEQAARKVA
jgi:orotate phosphoribosyltransferase